MNWNSLQATQPVPIQLLKGSLVKEKLPHAFIFEGEEGTPKEEAAFHLAKAFLCINRQEAEPCQECPECRRIESGNHPDVMVIRPEGLSIKKAQVEQLQKEFTYKGMESEQKIYIVYQADTMTASAANSLLKFLEEPDGETLAVLLTDNLHFLLDTVISRSQVIHFSALQEEEKAEYFMSQGEGETVAALRAYLASEETLSNKEEPAAWIVQGRTLVIQLTEEVWKRPQQMLLTLQDKWLNHFIDRDDIQVGLDMFLYWYRDLLYTKLGHTKLAYPDQVERLQKEALYRKEQTIAWQMEAVLEAKRQLAANVNPQLLMERLLLRLQEGS
ncbi:DNA polymerase III subunit delta' [Salsuginibacillus kocurii]|uniref:DNA polymerase III subunit delta' n=1 Tax=Salsuginibacillus kocurii TaxID=427078 RepID=UPI000367240D|nr:DNA polymerase III subunit delta' [Salsuginibacillus kocurii]